MIDCIIDVSDNDPTIDWHRAYAAGTRLAFVKAMQGADPAYRTYVAQSTGARAAGIWVVPYVFLARGPAPVQVIAAFAAKVKLVRGMPFALDWEGTASQTAPAADVEAIGTGLSVVASRVPVGYWGEPGSTPAVPTRLMDAYDRWVPRYPQVPQPPNFAAMHPASLAKRPPGALFWQYTSAGHVDGIAGPVDRSVWCGTVAELAAWVATGVRPKTFA